ncbi:hypothetical protein JCM8097_005449 [Rhodosporidiobolus ruineniae]
MSDAASPPYDWDRRFPTAWSSTRPALQAVADLAKGAYRAADKSAARSSILDAASSAGLRGKSKDKFLAFWNAELARLPPTTSAPLLAGTLKTVGLHPLVVAAIAGEDALDLDQPTWFNGNGGSRVKPADGGETDEEQPLDVDTGGGGYRIRSRSRSRSRAGSASSASQRGGAGRGGGEEEGKQQDERGRGGGGGGDGGEAVGPARVES